MPSKSKAQQRFFGMVDAYKKGEMKNPSNKIKKAAKGMSMSDVKDFAETKHKGLPEKVEENIEKKIIRMTESDLHNLVKESVNRILNEIGDTPKGQHALGRLAYRKGEERPRMGQNVGKMRKTSGNDIFKYADKAAHKNGMYGHEFGNGYDYQEDVDNWDNYSKQEKVTAIISRIMRIRGFNKLANSNVSIDDMSDEELLNWIKGEQSLYER